MNERRLELLVEYHGQQLEEERFCLTTLVTLLTVAIGIGAGVIAFAGLYLPRLESGRSAADQVSPILLALLPLAPLHPLVWSIAIDGKLRLARHNLRAAEAAFLDLSREANLDGFESVAAPPPATAKRNLQRSTIDGTRPAGTWLDRVSVAAVEWIGIAINLVGFATVTAVALVAARELWIRIAFGAIYLLLLAPLYWHAFRTSRESFGFEIAKRAWAQFGPDEP